MRSKKKSKRRNSRASAQTDKEKTLISKELVALNDRLNGLEHDFATRTGQVSEGQFTQLPVILGELGYEDEEAGIISGYIRDYAEFAKKIKTIETIIQSMDTVKSDIARKEEERKRVATEEENAKIGEEIKAMSTWLKQLEHDFTVVITGIDMATLYEKEEQKLDWEKKLEDICSPILARLIDLTDRPRRIQKLRSEILYYEQRIPEIQQGIEYIKKFMENVWDRNIRTRLEESEDFWGQQEKEFTAKLETARHQLFELEKEKMSPSEGMDYLFESVIKRRGKNILFALLAFLVTFFVFYLLRRFIMAINVLKLFRKSRSLANLIDVLLYVLTFVMATASMIFTLYMVSDWVLRRGGCRGNTPVKLPKTFRASAGGLRACARVFLSE